MRFAGLRSPPVEPLPLARLALSASMRSMICVLGASVGSSVISSRSEEHTSELQSRLHLVCRLLLEKKKKNNSEQQREAGTRAPRRNTYCKQLRTAHTA